MSTLLGERYALIRRIGKGGYGDVWLARDETLHIDVAVKILNVSDRSRKASQQKTERFRHEAISMAKIEHDSVVAIYDVGAVAKKQELFLVMELLEGRSLFEEFVLNGPLEPKRCLRRFIEALGGLEAAHQAGVIHKDLKPANLFLHQVDQPGERLKVIDFGIARMDSLSKLTHTGRMAGSPRYLAPEYIMGERVTPAVDVYQMALILVEALTGAPCIPQSLEFFEVCQRHVLGELDVPPLLADSSVGPILKRALQRNPADRYQSAREFADALASVRAESLPQLKIEKLRAQEETTNRYAAVSGAAQTAAPDATPNVAEPPPAKRTARGPSPMVWLVWIAAATLIAAIATAAAIQLDRQSQVPKHSNSDESIQPTP